MEEAKRQPTNLSDVHHPRDLAFLDRSFIQPPCMSISTLRGLALREESPATLVANQIPLHQSNCLFRLLVRDPRPGRASAPPNSSRRRLGASHRNARMRHLLGRIFRRRPRPDLGLHPRPALVPARTIGSADTHAALPSLAFAIGLRLPRNCFLRVPSPTPARPLTHSPKLGHDGSQSSRSIALDGMPSTRHRGPVTDPKFRGRGRSVFRVRTSFSLSFSSRPSRRPCPIFFALEL